MDIVESLGMDMIDKLEDLMDDYYEEKSNIDSDPMRFVPIEQVMQANHQLRSKYHALIVQLVTQLIEAHNNG